MTRTSGTGTPTAPAGRDRNGGAATKAGRGGLEALGSQLAAHGLDADALLDELAALAIETPSWGYSDSGTRFHVFPWPGAARTVWERIEDAALVNSLTGACPSVAIHIPWDRVEDFTELRQFAEQQGVRLGAVNPNLFQDDAYRLGSLCHPDKGVRRRAVGHLVDCIAIARQVDSKELSVWLADGTNYPGQDDFRGRYRRLVEGLEEVYAALPEDLRMLVEYKLFEPAFYGSDLPDWGTSLLVCRRLGPQAQVLVDVGHHAQGTNVEQIVAVLLEEGALGALHLNGRKYADDDLISGSINPFELFLIMNEIVSAQRDPRTSEAARRLALTIDQNHNVEDKIGAMIQSVVNIQTAYAKALIVDRERLRRAQADGDVLAAHRALVDAYETDVRPLLAHARGRLGLAPDPLEAFRTGGYAEALATRREASAAGSEP
jgi:L-rhamnose isomerase/sugar isomerase